MRDLVLNIGFSYRKLISGLKLMACGDKSFLILIFCIYLGSVPAHADSIVGQQDKNILILFAMSPSTPAYRLLIEGIRQKLDDEYGTGYNLHSEYLELEHYPKDAYP
mgnify:CR=1 FL=1